MHSKFTLYGIFWSFSIWLEALAILPQLYMIAKNQDVENITAHYVLFLGFYRIFYLLHWYFIWFISGFTTGKLYNTHLSLQVSYKLSSTLTSFTTSWKAIKIKESSTCRSDLSWKHKIKENCCFIFFLFICSKYQVKISNENFA